MKFAILVALMLAKAVYAKKGADLYSNYITTFGKIDLRQDCMFPDGKFNTLLCDFSTTKCTLEKTITNPVEVSTQVQFKNLDRNSLHMIVANAPEIENSMKEFLPLWDGRYIDLDRLPVGTQLRFYHLGRQRDKLTFLGESKVTQDGIMTIDFKELKTKTIYITKKNTEIDMVIDKVKIAGITVEPAMKLDISKGIYDVEVDLKIKDKPYSKKFSIVISDELINEERKNLNLEIDGEGLKEKTFPPSYADVALSHSPDSNQLMIFNLNYGMEGSPEKFFMNLDFVAIDGSTNLKDYFKQIIGEFGFYSAGEHSQKILDQFKNKITAKLKIDGECGIIIRKDIKLLYSLYKEASEVKKIGHLFLNSQYEIFFLDQENKLSQFKPNILFNDCNSHPRVAHQLKAVKGKWGNLGEGPWGDSAWILLDKSALHEGGGYTFILDDSGDIFYKFIVEGDYVRLKGSGLKPAGTKDESDGGCGGNYIDIEKVVKWEKVFNKKGIIKLPKHCSIYD